MNTISKAYLVGGGIGSLAAAAFMIRDGNFPGRNISILEAAPVMGGSLDGAGDPALGYSMRGGRMLTTDNYECTWDLYRSIPSLIRADKTVFEETVEFNEAAQVECDGAARGLPSREGPGDFHGVLDAGPARVVETQPDRRRIARRQLYHATGYRPVSSRPSSGTCGARRSLSSPGTVLLSSSVICSVSFWSSPASRRSRV